MERSCIHWLALAVILEDCQPALMHKHTWISITNADHMLMTSCKKCSLADCIVCGVVFGVKEQSNVQGLLQDGDFLTFVKLYLLN